MAGLFDKPKEQNVPVPNPDQAANQLNDALTRRLQSGGVNADTLSPGGPLNAASAAPRAPSLTGLN